MLFTCAVFEVMKAAEGRVAQAKNLGDQRALFRSQCLYVHHPPVYLRRVVPGIGKQH